MHGTKNIYQGGREAFRNSVGSLYMRADSVDATSLSDGEDEDEDIDPLEPVPVVAAQDRVVSGEKAT